MRLKYNEYMEHTGGNITLISSSLCSCLNISSIIWSEVRRGNAEPTGRGFWVITLYYCLRISDPNKDHIALLFSTMRSRKQWTWALLISLLHPQHICASRLGLHVVSLLNTESRQQLMFYFILSAQNKRGSLLTVDSEKQSENIQIFFPCMFNLSFAQSCNTVII